MLRRRLARSTVGIVVLVLGAAACSETTTSGAADQPAGADVLVADSDLGQILTDAQGNTLYVFLPDGDGHSACTGDCAATWPPLASDGEPEAGNGVEGEVGSMTRDDATLQITVGGAPVYTYSGDEAPGDTNGEGVGDVWYVAAPTGEPMMDAGGGATSPPGGYGY